MENIENTDKKINMFVIKFRSSLFKGLRGQGAAPLSLLARSETPLRRFFWLLFFAPLVAKEK